MKGRSLSGSQQYCVDQRHGCSECAEPLIKEEMQALRSVLRPECGCVFLEECKRPPNCWGYANCGSVVVFKEFDPTDLCRAETLYRRTLDKLCLERDMAKCLQDKEHRSKLPRLYSWMQERQLVSSPKGCLDVFMEKKEMEISEMCYRFMELMEKRATKTGE